MKKTDEQLQNEVTEIRRFVDRDPRDVAIKPKKINEFDEDGDAFVECICGAMKKVNEMHFGGSIYCWKCGQKLRLE